MKFSISVLCYICVLHVSYCIFIPVNIWIYNPASYISHFSLPSVIIIDLQFFFSHGVLITHHNMESLHSAILMRLINTGWLP